GYPIRTVPVILGMLVLAGCLGGLNGTFVAKLGMPPFIVTLSTFYLFNGTALLVSDTPAGRVTSVLTNLAIGRIGPIPYIFVVLLVATAVVWFLLYRTAWGKHL